MPSAALSPCEGGEVVVGGARFACSNVDLLAWEDFGGLPALANDIWGWTDPLTGMEVVILGIHSGTAFVDISDPESPVVLGTLPSATQNSFWGDIRVHRDHAYIVKDVAGAHGIQILDLTTLRNVANPPQTLTATNHYTDLGYCHNITLNEATGFAYALGADTCNGGLHMLDLSQPDQPAFAGCWGGDGYIHDAQCVIYSGPDTEHVGREICFTANPQFGGRITIVDVTDKANPRRLSATNYDGAAYTHQGWLTEDQRHFLLGDEFDEINFEHGTKTHVFDVSDLDAPFVTGSHVASTEAGDHNLFVRGQHVFQANNTNGLRILRTGDLARSELTSVGHFDTYPVSEQLLTGIGAWGNYPFFESGVVAVSDTILGLFILRPDLTAVPECSDGIDNDADGETDSADPSCADANGPSESDGAPCDGPDSDGDGVADSCDNCVAVSNAGQQDANAGADDDSSQPGSQHYGDACDADLDDDGLVGASDFFDVLRPCFGADPTARPECAVADLDADGSVGASDFFGAFRASIGGPPGPGATGP